MMKIEDAIEIAKNNYSKIQYDHARCVLYNFTFSPLVERLSYEEFKFGQCVALLHDILEDTDYKFKPEHIDIKNAVEKLTNKHLEYAKYCRTIKRMAVEDNNNLVIYIVKLADISDHLQRKATLTDKLKEKYLSGLAELL